MSVASSVARRNAIVALLVMTAASTGLAMAAGSLHAKSASPSTTTVSPIEPSNALLGKLKGKHRQFFDNPSVNGGIALVHAMNYYDTYNKAFGVKDVDALKAVAGGFGRNVPLWNVGDTIDLDAQSGAGEGRRLNRGTGRPMVAKHS
ncbi:MAG TPA: hypothetical protein VGP95_08425 [Gemmatimonadaceae bacterium]|jgi:hypothetical protein|nr:hypothetical protein [Gemmatimonadaceae bacterium]